MTDKENEGGEGQPMTKSSGRASHNNGSQNTPVTALSDNQGSGQSLPSKHQTDLRPHKSEDRPALAVEYAILR